jgi:hypothetical protein
MICSDCQHWYHIDAERKCPRLSTAKAQATGYIASNLNRKEKLSTKIFEGTRSFSTSCSSFKEKLNE